MTPRRLLLIGVAVAGLAAAGAGVASGVMDLPQDAVPVQDPVGDALRERAASPVQTPDPAPAPSTAPPAEILVAPGAPMIVSTPEIEIAAVQEDVPDEVEEETVEAEDKPATPPGVRQRRRVALVQAVNKVTAEAMKFEVPVGGRPIRFNKTLILTARACEVSASDEATEDSIAYLEVGIQPRGMLGATEVRQIFKGWMFASSPGVNTLQHPVYDAWVIGCKS
ncbi:DUF2155 domain-containing protein [Brevundimonas vesicularis]|uniref:DUF2155 domain-containing protein n=1 Tax=Brevundimonas vesicularis TaxID=41276 RepID=UPI0038D48566